MHFKSINVEFSSVTLGTIQLSEPLVALDCKFKAMHVTFPIRVSTAYIEAVLSASPIKLHFKYQSSLIRDFVHMVMETGNMHHSGV